VVGAKSFACCGLDFFGFFQGYDFFAGKP
jgi:hypothetical protein